ncbi:MAG: hypothetical protein LBD42_05725 [Desulfovibrio sp.]|jgi:hypothetical protein|nr:hypothetical protein [Desulfovibrio sp.]
MPGSRPNPALLAAIIRFNAPEAGDFAPEALPEPAAALLRNGVLRRLEGSWTGRAMVRAWLFRQLDLNGCFTDFQEEIRRLALLHRESVRGLALLYGACVYAPEAAVLVRREDVASLRAGLGTHYDYALAAGRFQIRRARDIFASFRPDEPLLERMTAAGFAAMRCCLAAWPAPLARLADARLPAELRRKALPAADADDERFLSAWGSAAPDLFWPDLKKLLLSEVAPQWQTCFA